MALVAGVDGYRHGGVVVVSSDVEAELTCVPDFNGILTCTRHCATVAIDMPIGLLEVAVRGGRKCEQEARALPWYSKPSSVFSSPVRAALAGRNHEEACALNRAAGPSGIGISKQAFELLDKIRDIDRHIRPEFQKRLKEIHPEVSFAALAEEFDGAAAPLARKDKPLGRAQRARLLATAGFTGVAALVAAGKRGGARHDDVLDACIAAWSAERIRTGLATSAPAEPPKDRHELEMAIWYRGDAKP